MRLGALTLECPWGYLPVERRILTISIRYARLPAMDATIDVPKTARYCPSPWMSLPVKVATIAGSSSGGPARSANPPVMRKNWDKIRLVDDSSAEVSFTTP